MVQVQQRADLDLRVDDISSKVYGKMEHKYLTQIVRTPELDSLQLEVSTAILREAGLPQADAETIVQTLLLIYHGLAVHDDIEELTKRPDERYRQLGVLAGDFYSSKYYRLLAQAGQIAMVGHLAQAIQTINEAKAELERDPMDFSLHLERYLDMQETIHGTLLHALRVAYVPDQPIWEELVTMLVRTSVLVRELQNPSQSKWKRTAANLLVWQQANSEERRGLKALTKGKGSDSQLLSLHVKYGTSSDLYQQIEDCVGVALHTIQLNAQRLQSLSGVCSQLLESCPLPGRAVEEVRR